MFEHGFPSHWSTIKKLIWLKGAGIIGGAEDLPDGYTKLDYLTNANGAYIDTGINLNNGCKITIKFLRRSKSRTNAVIFGWRYDGTYETGNQVYINYNNSTTQSTVAAGWKIIIAGVPAIIENVGNTNCFLPEQDETVVIDSANEKVLVDGDEITLNYDFSNGQAFNSSGTSGVHPYLFALNNAGTEAVISNDTRVYFYKVEENGVLVQNMIPCIDPNNVYGMYDTVSKTFFGSANNKVFTGQISGSSNIVGTGKADFMKLLS